MAGHDIFNDTLPHQEFTPDRIPTITQYREAIEASDVADSYNLQQATLNDLRAICRVHEIQVPKAPEPEPDPDPEDPEEPVEE